MKKSVLFILFILCCTTFVSAQRPQNGDGGRLHKKFHQKHLRYATLDNGKRVVLFPDGTWDFAAVQVPQRPNYHSEFWGNKLF